MHKHTFHSVLLWLFAVAAIANAARIPPGWRNAVVAIGHTAAGPGVSEWSTEASGFFYGYLVRDDPDPSTRGYEVYRITNKHVIANHAQIEIGLNPKKTSDQGELFRVPMIDPATESQHGS